MIGGLARPVRRMTFETSREDVACGGLPTRAPDAALTRARPKSSRRVRFVHGKSGLGSASGVSVSLSTPQPGIFALGTASHAYLELDLQDGARAADLVAGIADLREPRTTIGGINFVAGFRPELWLEVAPDDTPPGLHGFDEPLVGPDGYTMPATQHDALLWLAGSSYDVVFDVARAALSHLAPLARATNEVSCWPYRHHRDLTGFIDGTENPSVAEAQIAALIPPGASGAGGSVVLLQQWIHDTAWDALPVHAQEQAMGRTKEDSVELDDRPEDSHVARTDQEEFGDIFRRNMPFGTVIEHGTMFVGFSAEQQRLSRMLESMAGMLGTPRDALTRYAKPVTGSYYFVPSVPVLEAFGTAEDED